jgi:hypothetical protein
VKVILFFGKILVFLPGFEMGILEGLLMGPFMLVRSLMVLDG